MNDRFLFRGKYNGKIWAYGNLHICKHTNHHHIIGGKEADEHVEINLVYNNVIEVDPTTVGQCTGLKDKNGRLIFEGDMVKLCDTNPIVFIVSIEIRKYGWACVFRYADDGKIDTSAFLDRCEVIGNIHDNPELMEGTNV